MSLAVAGSAWNAARRRGCNREGEVPPSRYAPSEHAVRILERDQKMTNDFNRTRLDVTRLNYFFHQIATGTAGGTLAWLLTERLLVVIVVAIFVVSVLATLLALVRYANAFLVVTK